MKASRSLAGLIGGVTALLCHVAPPVAAQAPAPASAAPSVTVGKLAAPPVIDGVLGGDEWDGAARVEMTFQIQPGDNTPASEATDVLIASDRDSLFLAFRAYDRDPSALRARIVRRDDLAEEDYVAIYLDTYADRQRAYGFIFNPLGIQQDGIYDDADGLDLRWDGILESKGSVLDDGYVVEVAIPFKTMRFRAGPEARWGLQLQRRIARRAEVTSWLRHSRDISGRLQQAGELTGLEGVPARSSFDLIPTLTGLLDSAPEATSADGRRFRTGGQLDPGLTAIYSIAPDLTVSGTVNPDFSQIESDVPQISVNQRFALYYPERRPFFLEGAEIFSPLSEDLIRLLDTRRVIDAAWGVKLTGKVGPYSIGGLTTSDHVDAQSQAAPGETAGGRHAQVATVRVRRDLLEDSAVGGWFIDRRTASSSNTVGSLDGRLRVSQAGHLFVNLTGTRVREVDREMTGQAFDVRLNHIGRHWRIYVGDRYVSPDFRNDAGFIDRVNYHEQAADVGYEWRPENKSRLSRWLVYLWPYLDTRVSRVVSDGTPEVQYVDPALKVQFQRGTSLNCYMSFHREGFAGLTFGYRFGACDHTVEAFKRVSVTGSFAIGEGLSYDPASPVIGHQVSLEQEVSFKPNDRLNLGLRYVTSRLSEPGSDVMLLTQDIVRSRTTWQLTRFHSARAIFDYDTDMGTFNASLLYAWSPSPNTSVHLGWNELLADDRLQPPARAFDRSLRLSRQQRSIFMKLSYDVRR